MVLSFARKLILTSLRRFVVLKKNSFETGYLYKKNRRHLECPQLGVTPKFLLVRLESRIYTLELNWGLLFHNIFSLDNK